MRLSNYFVLFILQIRANFQARISGRHDAVRAGAAEPVVGVARRRHPIGAVRLCARRDAAVALFMLICRKTNAFDRRLQGVDVDGAARERAVHPAAAVRPIRARRQPRARRPGRRALCALRCVHMLVLFCVNGPLAVNQQNALLVAQRIAENPQFCQRSALNLVVRVFALSGFENSKIKNFISSNITLQKQAREIRASAVAALFVPLVTIAYDAWAAGSEEVALRIRHATRNILVRFFISTLNDS